MLYTYMKIMSEYNEIWHYITLCRKILSWQVARNDVTGWTVSVYQLILIFFYDKKYCVAMTSAAIHR